MSGRDNGYSLRALAPLVDFVGPHAYPMEDDEVRQLVMDGYETARQIVSKHRNSVRAMAEELLQVESLDADGIKAIIVANAAPASERAGESDRPNASATGESGHVGSGVATYPAWARRPWKRAVSEAQNTSFTHRRTTKYS